MKSRIKISITILFVCFIINSTYGQLNLELQAGGSNFLGLSFNTVYKFKVSKNDNNLLSFYWGSGYLIPTYEKKTIILHIGTNYSYKKIGFGAEISRFKCLSEWPFYSYNFVDLIIYPNMNYKINFSNKLYLNLSIGAYLAYSNYYENKKVILKFEGDVIPGAGLNLGYKF